MVEYRDITTLKGDGRTLEVKHWTEWLRRVPRIRRKFRKWGEGFDPFDFNEAASVAVLANAASQAGYLAHTEYIALKRHASRGRPFRQGRCDLWVADIQSQTSWAFEFKQHFASDRIKPATFNERLARAYRDAKDLDHNEADRRSGCLIIVPRDSTGRTEDLIGHFDGLCDTADVAFRIGDGTSAIWFAFKFVK